MKKSLHITLLLLCATACTTHANFDSSGRASADDFDDLTYRPAKSNDDSPILEQVVRIGKAAPKKPHTETPKNQPNKFSELEQQWIVMFTKHQACSDVLLQTNIALNNAVLAWNEGHRKLDELQENDSYSKLEKGGWVVTALGAMLVAVGNSAPAPEDLKAGLVAVFSGAASVLTGYYSRHSGYDAIRNNLDIEHEHIANLRLERQILEEKRTEIESALQAILANMKNATPFGPAAKKRITELEKALHQLQRHE